MSVWLMLLVIFATFWAMEFVAWFTHKYVMHGFLWVLHKDHHQKGEGFFEKNDAFFLIFAIPSWLCIMLGMMFLNDMSLSIGIGIAVYGFTYFLVHEVFIHQRLPFLKKAGHRYFEAIRYAHKMHHKHLDKEEGESYGMLLIHPRYWQAVQNRKSGKLQASASR